MSMLIGLPYYQSTCLTSQQMSRLLHHYQRASTEESKQMEAKRSSSAFGAFRKTRVSTSRYGLKATQTHSRAQCQSGCRSRECDRELAAHSY